MFDPFGLSKDPDAPASDAPVDIHWVRNPKGRFHNLMFLDTTAEKLPGMPGVYAIWHGGAGAKWLFVGATQDLSKTLARKIDDPAIEFYYDQVSVYVTWSPVKPEYHGGIVCYLTKAMKPEIENPNAKKYADETPIAVFLPGLEPPVSKTAK